MLLEEVDEFFKGYLPYYVLIFLPIFIIISPANPVYGAHDFPVYRMQQFDLHGIPHGCRNALINLEARSLDAWSSSRHCVLSRVQDLTVEHFRNIKAKAGALLIIIPEYLSELNNEQKQNFQSLESAILSQEITIPIYFLKNSSVLNTIYHDISQNIIVNDLSKSAAETMFSSIAANGYQIVVSTNNPSVKSDAKIATIQGQLIGNNRIDGKTPTIAIVAHYDTFGVAPELAFGADSNGSGLVILLELVRLFSELYENPKTHGKYNILFLLTGGGKLNYQGSKKWLEDQLDTQDGSLLQGASYVMCLDTLTHSNSLYMHVSKPPKEGSPASLFYKDLKTAAEKFSSFSVEGVHKKINLADEILAWEHERFSIGRLPAFTLSSLKSHKDHSRSTILDTKESLDVDRLVKSTKVIAEALASHIYNVAPSGEIFGKSLDIEKSHIEAWVDILATQPRSAQILSNKENALIKFFKETFDNKLVDVKISYVVPDKRDPEFQFYDVTKGIVNVYSVKPAVFDLVLTVAIVIYLGGIYLFIHKFSICYNVACSLTTNKKQM